MATPQLSSTLFSRFVGRIGCKRGTAMIRRFRAIAAVLALTLVAVANGPPATAQQPTGSYSVDELVSQGHRFFGEVSQGVAGLVEQSVAQYGLPNGYVLGQEGSVAFIGGVRYGQGTLYTKNAGQHPIFWQGPSLGPDYGANGDRVMMLVYNLPAVDALYARFVGVAGSAHFVAGLGMTVLARGNMYVVPIVSGVGARLGVNLGYVKFTDRRTWNPF